MTPEIQALAAFVTGLRETTHASRSERSPFWARKILTHPHPGIGYGNRCVYCGVALGLHGEEGTVRCTADHVVPLSSGGPNIVASMVPACYPCNRAKGSADLLFFGKAIESEKLQRLRLKMLEISANHLVRNPREAWQKADVQAALAKRWAKPRTAFYACCLASVAFIGARAKARWSADIGKVLADLEVVPLSRGASVWVVDRAKFLPVVWSLIDLNALVSRIDIPGQQDATPADDPELARWAETYRNVGEIVLRRGYVPRINGRCPRRSEGVPAPKTYPTKPLAPGEIRKPRAPRGTGRRALAAQRKVEEAIEWLRRKPAKQFYEPGPRERAYLEGLTPERERLLDLAWRNLAYEAAGVEMPRRRRVRKVRAAKSYFHGRRGRTERLAQRAAEDRAWEQAHCKPEGWLKR